VDIYQLEYVLHEPEESHGWMYRAEIPALQGCRAWGDTPAETLEALWGNARTFLQLRKENGEPLPHAITPTKTTKGFFTVPV
jgi:predicted RNase H-like HicB family nuclease